MKTQIGKETGEINTGLRRIQRGWEKKRWLPNSFVVLEKYVYRMGDNLKFVEYMNCGCILNKTFI